jgi:hypothetical protein
MKENPELLMAKQYNETCLDMLAFQERNNRLSYSDDQARQKSENPQARAPRVPIRQLFLPVVAHRIVHA